MKTPSFFSIRLTSLKRPVIKILGIDNSNIIGDTPKKISNKSNNSLNQYSPGKLFTQCNAKLDVTISTLSSSNGNLHKLISPLVKTSSSNTIFLHLIFCNEIILYYGRLPTNHSTSNISTIILYSYVLALLH